MACVYICDACGCTEEVSGKGNQRPFGWATVRITTRREQKRGADVDVLNSVVCPKCLTSVREVLR